MLFRSICQVPQALVDLANARGGHDNITVIVLEMTIEFVTPELGTWGKGWIIFMMIVGRVGVLTFSYIIVGTGTVNGITHAEENMMIG